MNLPGLIRTGRSGKLQLLIFAGTDRSNQRGESQWVFTGSGNPRELDGWLSMGAQAHHLAFSLWFTGPGQEAERSTDRAAGFAGFREHGSTLIRARIT